MTSPPRGFCCARFLSALLIVALTLPPPAFALRGENIGQRQTGLEELENRLGGRPGPTPEQPSDAGLEEQDEAWRRYRTPPALIETVRPALREGLAEAGRIHRQRAFQRAIEHIEVLRMSVSDWSPVEELFLTLARGQYQSVLGRYDRNDVLLDTGIATLETLRGHEALARPEAATERIGWRQVLAQAYGFRGTPADIRQALDDLAPAIEEATQIGSAVLPTLRAMGTQLQRRFRGAGLEESAQIDAPHQQVAGFLDALARSQGFTPIVVNLERHPQVRVLAGLEEQGLLVHDPRQETPAELGIRLIGRWDARQVVTVGFEEQTRQGLARMGIETTTVPPGPFVDMILAALAQATGLEEAAIRAREGFEDFRNILERLA